MGEFSYSNADELAAKYELRSKETPAMTRAVARDVGDFIVHAAQVAAPKRTTRLARSIKRSGVSRTGPDSWTVDVFSDLHRAKFTERGTGWYDPEGSHYIFPLHGKYMRWIEKGAFHTLYSGAGIFSSQIKGGKNPQHAIFARYTRGQKGQHFFEHAVEEAERIYIPARLRELGIEITR